VKASEKCELHKTQNFSKRARIKVLSFRVETVIEIEAILPPKTISMKRTAKKFLEHATKCCIKKVI